MKGTAAALLLCALPALGQQKPALPPLVERIEVNVVNVDVTVLDRSGKPVSDLTKDDFEIREDGVLQQITNFSVVQRETIAPRSRSRNGGAVSSFSSATPGSSGTRSDDASRRSGETPSASVTKEARRQRVLPWPRVGVKFMCISEFTGQLSILPS